MPTVLIPGPLRELAGGARSVNVPGATVGQVINNLDARYPGMAARLCAGDRLRPGIVVAVDGVLSRQGPRQPVTESSEILFLTQVAGG